jgi:hypothetical protein
MNSYGVGVLTLIGKRGNQVFQDIPNVPVARVLAMLEFTNSVMVCHHRVAGLILEIENTRVLVDNLRLG